MKKTIVFTTALFMATLLMAGNDKYFEKMGKTLAEFTDCESVEGYQALANKFQTIGRVEKDEWLPRYYEAHCYILMSFQNGISAADRDLYLGEAEPLVEEVITMAPRDPEALTLQTLWYTGKLVVNPPARSRKLQPLIAHSLAEAFSIEPGHPRALFMRISNNIGNAAFFGNDTTPYCKEARELLANWDKYQVPSPIHPNWGKKDVEGIVERCGL